MAKRAARKKPNGAPIVSLGDRDWSYYFANHDARIAAIDDMSATLQQDIRDLRLSQSAESRRLNDRIDLVQDTVTRKLDEQTKTLTEHFDTGIAGVTAHHQKNTKRIISLETWRTFIAGGSVVVLFVFGDVLIRIFYNPIAQVILSFWK